MEKAALQREHRPPKPPFGRVIWSECCVPLPDAYIGAKSLLDLLEVGPLGGDQVVRALS
jgi:hypothetical protein